MPLSLLQVFCYSDQSVIDGKDHQSLNASSPMQVQSAGKVPLTLCPISFLPLDTNQDI